MNNFGITIIQLERNIFGEKEEKSSTSDRINGHFAKYVFEIKNDWKVQPFSNIAIIEGERERERLL